MNKLQKTSQHYNVKPVTMILRSSRWLALLFLLMGAIASISIILLPWAWWLKTCLIAGITAIITRQIWRDAWRMHPSAPVKIELNHEGKLWLTLRNGTRHAAQVLGSSVVTPNLTVLNLKLERGKASCLIMPDSVDAEAFRRLRVWLRWGVHEDSNSHEGE